MALDIVGLIGEMFYQNGEQFLIVGGSLIALGGAFGLWRGLVYLKQRGWKKDAEAQKAMLAEKKKIHDEKLKLLNEMKRKEKDEVFRSLEPYVFHERTSVGKWSIQRFKESLIRRDLDRCIKVNMELSNGNFRSFLVKEKEKGFLFKGGKYIFDNEMKYYSVDDEMYCFDFHEEIATPIRRKIPVSDIKKSLNASKLSEVEFAINPQTLEQFVTAKIAEGIMKGQELDAWMSQMRIVVFAILIISIIHLLIFAKKSGMLDSVNLPF